jgi:hypothetical protein
MQIVDINQPRTACMSIRWPAATGAFSNVSRNINITEFAE